MSDTSLKKKITVSREHLHGGTRRRARLNKGISSTKLKDQFVRKIRSMQKTQRSQTKPKDVMPGPEEESSDGFQNALQFLKRVSDEGVKKASACLITPQSAPKPLQSAPKPLQSAPRPLQSAPKTPRAPPIVIKPPPPYSSIKGFGNRSYRQWKAETRKHPKDTTAGPRVHLDSFRPNALPNTLSNGPPNARLNAPPNSRLLGAARSRTAVKTVKLGKRGRNVSLLIYGKDNLPATHGHLTGLGRDDLTTMRAFLRKRNLLKSGSRAPNDVVRGLYASAMKAGDVSNKGKEVALHNFGYSA